MATNQEALKQVRQRKYLSRDFDTLRAQLLEYARMYYPDRIKDFSESSLGGMFLDLAAYVGDNLSFYLDHQYGELNVDTVVETTNIEKIIKNSGIPITGAAAAVVPVTFYIEIPSISKNNETTPDPDLLPVVKMNSIFTSDSGVSFNLLEDVDFGKKKSDGSYAAEIRVGDSTSNGTVLSYIFAAPGLCVSGKEITETFNVGSTFIPFRTLTLSNPNVTEIISVSDSFGNVYYEVTDLTCDVVYRNVLNTSGDNDIVKDGIKVISAPYRYTVQGDLSTRLTTLTFGGGNAETLEDDIIPDPSEFAISFPYSKTFSRISIDPSKLLQTKTLGVAATNTTLTITYRFGGGLDHNVPANSITSITSATLSFPAGITPGVAARIKNSLEVTNLVQASGGEDPLTADELLSLVPATKNAQQRVVTREDLLARVYTIPSNFGRVFRASIRSNDYNPLATQLFIVSRTPEGKLITSPDTLKLNLVKFLNPYRMISDAIDILDARIINLTLSFEIVIDPTLNKATVLQSVLAKLKKAFEIKNFHIDQPIVISEVTNTIFTVYGIISVGTIKFENVVSVQNGRTYSDQTFDVKTNTVNNIIIPPPGSIFEIRYPNDDIIGKVI